MIRRPPRSTPLYSSAASDVYKRQTPERAVWDQRAKKELQIYMALRPDSFCEWSIKNHMEELAHEDAHKYMAYWYEMAIDEQKKELKEYKKKIKLQEAKIVPVPMIIEEDLSQDQSDRLEPIKAYRLTTPTGIRWCIRIAE